MGHSALQFGGGPEEKRSEVPHAMLPFATYVREDGRLVTGQNPASAKAIGEAVVAKLKAGR